MKDDGLLWYGWVPGCEWQIRLLEGLGVKGAKRYNENECCIENCICDDEALACLIHYWPMKQWYPDIQVGVATYRTTPVEELFTLSGPHQDEQVWGWRRKDHLDRIREHANYLPDEWPEDVNETVRAWSCENIVNKRIT